MTYISSTGLLLLHLFNEKKRDSPEAFREACSRNGKDYLASTIKSTISRLRKKGLIEPVEVKTDGRLRRVYGITDEGLSVLDEYQFLQNPPANSPSPNCLVEEI